MTSVSGSSAIITVAPKETNTSSADYDETLTISAGSYSASLRLVQSNPSVVLKTATLSGDNMKAMSNAATGYNTEKSVTVDGLTWTSNGYQNSDNSDMIQLRARTNASGVSWIKLPEFSGNIVSIECATTGTSASSASGSASTGVLYFQSGNTSSETPLVTATGASTNTSTFDLSALSCTTGYITQGSGAGVRIWSITVTYK